MYERFNAYSTTRPRLRKTVGWSLVAIGFIALVTPLTPGGLLFFVGLELLGIRVLVLHKMKNFFRPAKETVAVQQIEQV